MSTGVIEDVEKCYSSSIEEFSAVVEKAIATSHAAAFKQVDERLYWAAILFTRLCTSSVSVLSLCPGSKLNQDGVHWDFSSVASLSRNIFECCLMFFYVGVDDIDDEQWRARRGILCLHDCMSRFYMFKDFDPNDDQLSSFENQANELRLILQSNTYFSTLPDKQRKKLLEGRQASILSQDEILGRMGTSWSGHRGLYRFYSAQTHSLPLGFFRTEEHGRGRGVENEVEKGYISSALTFNATTLKRCTDEMQRLFAHVTDDFSGHSFDLSILKPLS